jgi:ribosome-binding protein aMBF1 (putative translation factor)
MDAGYHVVDVDFPNERVTFGKPSIQYEVRRDGESILWTGSMVYALRVHLGISQAELSEMLGVRQQTISEWENNIYLPTRSRSKHLHMVAEKAGFDFGETEQTSSGKRP